jgi:DNA (cytosine-5)-methyltransferase 1
MKQDKPIPIVDLFAGPGGLGEGFSSIEDGNAFKILVSAEMEASAHKTLKLRSFYRILKRQGGRSLDSYYRFCNGESLTEWDANTLDAWKEADKEARCITLGSEEGNLELNTILDKEKLSRRKPWVLIGGPPCQAYSLVGRARNRGKADYCAEDDHRHFLYKEYLRIIQQYQPAVFVMENVKGILSAKIEGKHIFHTILRDLSDPDFAITKVPGQKYRIYSLDSKTVFKQGMDPNDIDVHDFIVHSEKFGIPQARHRVILLGVRDDIEASPQPLQSTHETTVRDAISDLPCLRSRISKEPDSPDLWSYKVRQHLDELLKESSARKDLNRLSTILKKTRKSIAANQVQVSGSLRMPLQQESVSANTELEKWYRDSKLKVWLNHEARSHMASDLRRYLYAAAYAGAYDRSPKGHKDFDLSGLRPDHKNWESGKFADRFRVQQANHPSTTVTSHIAKDGHYFIHPDPSQCRSLSVREAARLQTFPDNYFFQGNRTQQFHQVGNAVPPFLSYKIASIVKQLLNEHQSN